MSDLPQERFSSFNEFWPYYLSEHSVASCRYVHFIGTNGFVAYLIYLSSENLHVLIAFIAALILGKLAFASEAKRNASWALFLMIGLMTWVEHQKQLIWDIFKMKLWKLLINIKKKLNLKSGS